MLQRVFQDFKENTNHSQQPVITNNECLKYIICRQKINHSKRKKKLHSNQCSQYTISTLNESLNTNKLLIVYLLHAGMQIIQDN